MTLEGYYFDGKNSLKINKNTDGTNIKSSCKRMNE